MTVSLVPDDFVRQSPGPPPGAGAGAFELDAKGLRYVDLSASWSQVFGALRLDSQVYVLLARRPPDPPWIALSPRDLPEGVTMDGLVDIVRLRIAQTGYRDDARSRTPLKLNELTRQVLSGEQVPGALEVPIGSGPHGRTHKGFVWAFVGAGSVALGLAAGVAAGALAFSLGAVPLMLKKRPKVGGRVLVLAPDGCVIGLPAGPAAFLWPDVGGFVLGATRRHNRSVPCLRIENREGELIGSLEGSWFGAPLRLIVGVAEAYRTRLLQPL